MGAWYNAPPRKLMYFSFRSPSIKVVLAEAESQYQSTAAYSLENTVPECVRSRRLYTEHTCQQAGRLDGLMAWLEIFQAKPAGRGVVKSLMA
jgi:hypothetical protein